MLHSGQITIFRFAATDLPSFVQVIGIASVVLNVQFTALERGSVVLDESGRTPVLVFLDEFPIFFWS